MVGSDADNVTKKITMRRPLCSVALGIKVNRRNFPFPCLTNIFPLGKVFRSLDSLRDSIWVCAPPFALNGSTEPIWFYKIKRDYLDWFILLRATFQFNFLSGRSPGVKIAKMEWNSPSSSVVLLDFRGSRTHRRPFWADLAWWCSCLVRSRWATCWRIWSVHSTAAGRGTSPSGETLPGRACGSWGKCPEFDADLRNRRGSNWRSSRWGRWSSRPSPKIESWRRIVACSRLVWLDCSRVHDDANVANWSNPCAPLRKAGAAKRPESLPTALSFWNVNLLDGGDAWRSEESTRTTRALPKNRSQNSRLRVAIFPGCWCWLRIRKTISGRLPSH